MIVVIGISLFSTVSATILYVKPEASNSAWQGKSNVFSDLQSALSSAASGDQIWVAAGTYKPTTDNDRTISFKLEDGVELYGGFAGNETALSQRNWRVNETILSGDIGTIGLATDNSYHVLRADGTKINPITNSTILDGVIVEGGYASMYKNHNGGGLYLNFASPVIRNSWFRNHYAAGEGGAVFADEESPALIGNTIFTNNRAREGGGAAYSIYSAMQFHHCVFYKNYSRRMGSAVKANSTALRILNSIAWNNHSDEDKVAFVNTSVSYSLAQGGSFGTGNIDADPLWVDAENGDFRLRNDSPGINTGNSELIPDWLELDFEGEARTEGGLTNRGIYEGNATVPKLISPKTDSFFESDISEVEVSWETPINNGDDIIEFVIEYIHNGEEHISNISLETISYLIKDLNPLDVISWRLAYKTTNGDLNWSEWRTFRIRRTHHLHVTTSGTGNGSSWLNATSLHEALSMATFGDKVWVAAGTYKPTDGNDRTKSFDIKEGIEIYGGFIGNETTLEKRNWQLNQTILSGNISDPNIHDDNSYHVVTFIGSFAKPISNFTVFDGLIVEEGYANSNSGNNDHGGALFLSNASPLIRNVWIRNNFAISGGGAVYGQVLSSALFGNVLFTNNRTNIYGGAVYTLYSDMEFHNCLFSKNYSSKTGGAIYCNAFSNCILTNSIAWENGAKTDSQNFNRISAESSIIEGGYPGVGNIDSNPLFVDSDHDDYRLSASSPALNAGNVSILPEWLTCDLIGKPRVTNDKLNIGLYEGFVYTPILISPKNNVFYDEDITEIEVVWEIPDDSTVEYAGLFIEYFKNDEVPITIDVAQQQSYLFEELKSLDIIKLRVFGLTSEGHRHSSEWRTFRIKRGHPLYVKEGANSNGTSWQNAISLQQALSLAVFGDQIWVAEGTYKPTDGIDRTISFQLKDGIKLYGGFAGDETELNQRDWQINKCVLSGNIGDADISSDNSLHIIKAIGTSSDPLTAFTILDGFIVEEGYADLALYNDNGAGLFLNNASPIICNVWFRSNYAGSNGGAVCAENNSLAEFGNVIFTKNKSQDNGGAVSTNTSILQFNNCLFYGNSAGKYQGAMNSTERRTIVNNSIVWNNTSQNSFYQFNFTTCRNSIVQQKYLDTGNINEEPEFIDPDNEDFRLRYNSPAINAGNAELIPDYLSADYAGNQRPINNGVNVGIYEEFVYTPSILTPSHNSLLDGGATEVELAWQISDLSSEKFTEFVIEYIKNEDNKTSIESIKELTYVFSDLNPLDNIQWRVAAINSEGKYNWSVWCSFSVKRAYYLHVTTDGIGGGTSWQDAMSLQQAILTSVRGDQIWVAAGIYKPTDDDDRKISFKLKEGVELYGGFAGDETELNQRNWQTNQSILSGNIGENDVDTDNTYHVVEAIGTASNPITSSLLIDGFIVEKGYADLSENDNENGAGLYLSYASPIIRNVWFRKNRASKDGGAVYGISSTSAEFGNVLFTENTAGLNGGAVRTKSQNNQPAPHFHNCLFYDNYANNRGGGLYADNYYNDSAVRVYNSILWNNDAGNNYTQTSGVDIEHSLIQDPIYYSGDIKNNPHFVDPENGNFRLKENSSAIGTGSTEVVPDWLITDFAGNPRISEGVVNKGIYEGFIYTPSIISPLNNEVLDINLSDVEFSWQMPEGNTEIIARYMIEYKKNDSDCIIIDNIEGAIYTHKGFSSTDRIEWRVAAITNKGDQNWSEWQAFRIKRAHPLYVLVDGNGAGNSWSDATNLQNALSISIESDQIWVAAGTYKPTNDDDRTISFELKDGIEVYGGFAGDETELHQRNWQINKTILSGDIGEEGLDTDNSYHILEAIGTETNPITTSTILDGFIVEKGYVGINLLNNRGAGLYLKYASPIIINSEFRNNFSFGRGGAIYGEISSNAEFANTLFVSNNAGNDGGAVFASNSIMQFNNCIFYNNYSGEYGGAIYSTKEETHVINSMAWNNKAKKLNPQFRNITCNNSIVEGGYYGTDNIDAEPEFIDPDNNDFRLRNNSPALNAGDLELVPKWLTTDFSGNSRITNGNVNMGIYEGFVNVPIITSPVDDEIFDKNKLEVELQWQMPEGAYIDHESFLIEYIKNNETVIKVEVFGQLSYVLEELTPLDGFKWRVAIISSKGEQNWSKWCSFRVKRVHPLYVTTDGVGEGTSWQDAMSLQKALSTAVISDQIWVAAGIYYPTDDVDRNISFQLKDGIEVYGGFAGNETELALRNWQINRTILSGDIGEKGVDTDNSYNVVTAMGTHSSPIRSSLVVDGFIIEKGYADLSDAYEYTYNQDGGGLYISYASPIIRNVWFRQNYASRDGGSVYAISSTSAKFGNVLFTENTAARNGGAVCTQSQNNQPAPHFHNCLFYDNYAEKYGGGLYAENYSNHSPVSIYNSILWNNSSGVYYSQVVGVSTEYSLIQDYNFTSILNKDPLFINPDVGDFRLRQDSPAIGAGNSELVPNWLMTDFAGNSRITTESVNMGVYEGVIYPPSIISPLNKEVLDASLTEVELSWEMPEDNAEIITEYRFEYKKNDAKSMVIDNIEGTSYILTGLIPADKIEWRVAALDINGAKIWGSWNTFNVRRDMPIFVKSNGSGDGSSWYNSISLQQALAIAVEGEQIWVAAGTYKPTEDIDRTISFHLKEGVDLYGGFAGNEMTLEERNWRMNKTILSGDIGEQGVTNDNSLHVLTSIWSFKDPILSPSVFDGFIVEEGYANSYSNENHSGGGLYLSNASHLIRNVWFKSNYALSTGGAICGVNSSSVIFENILFTNNRVNNYGGAVYSSASDLEFYNCLFYDNYSDYWSGAIYGANTGAVKVFNSIAWNNDSGNYYSQFYNVSTSNSIVQGGYPGIGNIDADPLFMDPENGNFMLRDGSPAIDAGSKDSLPEFLTTDYLGLSRVQGNEVDMGPFESIVMANTMPANHAGAKESTFLGLEFRWGLKDGDSYDEAVIPGMQYHIRVWESGEEENLLFDKVITPGGLFPTDYNTTNLFGFSSGETYHWQIAMLLDDMEIWSDPTVFYLGHDHVIHVKEESNGTSGNNWNNAFGTLHEALEYAVPGDEIWVAGGTYYPVDVNNSSSITMTETETALQLKTGMSIYGGFAGTEITRNHRNYRANPTIISGDLSGTNDYSTSSKNLFINTGSTEIPIERGTIIDGFIFEHASQSAIVNNQASP
ncbi:MAG TPA: hypothetical protein GX005_04160, partial [Bacteroidales bacterium]|nr:hypothetical protein [Bacteroidales bacterium]